MAATKAFREDYTSSNPLVLSENFATYAGRLSRYQINWAMYENTAYRDVHTWAQSYKTAFGLYRYIRNIESPTARLGDFWQAHLWGGLLDAEAGDGQKKPSAIPITTKVETLRPAIAQLWQWSNWQSEKDVVTLRGSILGDSFIKIMDVPDKKKVYLAAMHPGAIKDIDADQWGNVKSYVIEENRPHPETGKPFKYREEATRNGEDVVYKTYMSDSLYAFSEAGAEYAVPYGFIPMIHVRNRNVGSTWGWSEMHNGMSLFREVDDQASLLDDQIRKMVNSVWFFAGVSKSSSGVVVEKTDPTDDNPDAGREDVPALYGPAGSSATALVAPLDITATAGRIEKLIAKIERDYPELADNIQNASGDISGRALRISRQPVIDKVQQRRPNYDEALVRAQQMAVAIGGWRNYDKVFSGFDLDSYKAGKLDHSIADRPVFAKDPLDDLEVEQAFWTAAQAAKTAGGMTGMRFFFRKNGWDEKQIAEFENSPENEARIEALKASANGSRAMSGGEFNGQTMTKKQNQQPDVTGSDHNGDEPAPASA